MIKKSLFFSLLGHLAFFGIFSFSFNPGIPRGGFADISFWGNILGSSDFRHEQPLRGLKLEQLFPNGLSRLRLNTRPQAKGFSFSAAESVKPRARLAFLTEKSVYQNPPEHYPPALKKESVVMLHPSFPYYFNLYFKDRQAVHIELAFKIIPRGRGNSVLVSRKISSGNLEVDLLSMRYLSHYLFLQQSALAPNSEQTVKIDFSPKE